MHDKMNANNKNTKKKQKGNVGLIKKTVRCNQKRERESLNFYIERFYSKLILLVFSTNLSSGEAKKRGSVQK